MSGWGRATAGKGLVLNERLGHDVVELLLKVRLWCGGLKLSSCRQVQLSCLVLQAALLHPVDGYVDMDGLPGADGTFH